MKSTLKLAVVILGSVGLATPCMARVLEANTCPKSLDGKYHGRKSSNVKCLDLSKVNVVKPLGDGFLSSEDMNKYLAAPNKGSMTPTTDSMQAASQVGNVVGQRMSDSMMNNPDFKESSIGRFIHKLENLSNPDNDHVVNTAGPTNTANAQSTTAEVAASMTTDPNLKKVVNNNSDSGKSSAFHYGIKTPQRMAEIVYEGFIKTSINYVAGQSANLIFSKPLTEQTSVQLINSAGNGNSSSVLTLSHHF